MSIDRAATSYVDIGTNRTQRQAPPLMPAAEKLFGCWPRRGSSIAGGMFPDHGGQPEIRTSRQPGGVAGP